MTVLHQTILCSLAAFMLFHHSYAQPLEIWQIQGSGARSPYEFQDVFTEDNIVTAKGNGFFFIQTPAQRSDDDPLTSDGIQVNAAYFGQVGDVVSISGRVLEVNGMTLIGSSGLDISLSSSGAELPLPIPLDDNLPAPVPMPVHSLERVEGMRVSFAAMASGPARQSGLTPLTAGSQRPFREPGIAYPGRAGLPTWDSNPEVFWLDPNGLNAPNNRFIHARNTVQATAIMVQQGPGFWTALPESYTVSGAPLLTPARPPAANEFTVASLNALLLLPDAPNLNQRLRKLAIYINEQMQLPDILALQEVGSLSVLQDLAYYIRQEAPGVNYTAYWARGNSQDLHLGFLVRPGVQVNEVVQMAKDEFFSLGGSLFGRPPLLLEAQLPTSPPSRIRVLNLHLRSLIGIEGPDSTFVRRKRHEQSLAVARMVQELQASGNLIILGDLNAYPFTDGYVDVANQISGAPSLGALFPLQPIVSPPLTNLVEALPQEERYSFVFAGNAQALDHCLVSSEMAGLIVRGMQYARGNADNAEAFIENPQLAARSSDHDGLVLYLEAENTVSAAGDIRQAPGIVVHCQQPLRPGDAIGISSTDGALLFAEIFNFEGKSLWRQVLEGTSSRITWPPHLAVPQVYVLRVWGERGGMAVKKVVVF